MTDTWLSEYSGLVETTLSREKHCGRIQHKYTKATLFQFDTLLQKQPNYYLMPILRSTNRMRSRVNVVGWEGHGFWCPVTEALDVARRRSRATKRRNSNSQTPGSSPLKRLHNFYRTERGTGLKTLGFVSTLCVHGLCTAANLAILLEKNNWVMGNGIASLHVAIAVHLTLLVGSCD
ncbi:hypothetical protein B0J13DRAFT_524711 [Dactylonectria estremocensis]|uniref:Uncharacterized protein n=1 Tax=Dactylonectria estremocensis TaxID=1079267 RepID=A0A9P9EXL9_9HYPO|nr:hypothetical protein B0J13DRAFT_524711 [Dactylonectria estremocensis]